MKKKIKTTIGILSSESLTLKISSILLFKFSKVFLLITEYKIINASPSFIHCSVKNFFFDHFFDYFLFSKKTLQTRQLFAS